MKIFRTIPILLLLAASSVWGAVPKMTSDSFSISSSEISAMGDYKTSDSYLMWDTSGQPSPIGAWLGGDGAMGGNNSGAGWIYTISLPILYDRDHDHDGMPLVFEQQFALYYYKPDPEDPGTWVEYTMWDYNPADAPMDFDGDGYANIQEFLAKTDPTDASSFFEFTDIRLVGQNGDPLLGWVSKTAELDGFMNEYPNYRQSLGFDILYADWSASSQEERTFPGEDWFNLTGAWQLLEGGAGLKRDGEFNSFTEYFIGGAPGTGDIRFYRVAISGTWDQGTPQVTWGYYSATGDMLICSTLAPDVLMIQKHRIPAASDSVVCGLPGENTGNNGVLNSVLGTDLFPAGGSPPGATNIQMWVPDTAYWSVDYLQDDGEGGGYGWWAYGQGESWRTINPENGFSLYWYDGYEPSSAINFYAGGRLKLDTYYKRIHVRNWQDNPDPITPDNPAWGDWTTTQATLFSYNFPVDARFTQDFDPAFPKLAGSSTNQGLYSFFYNDWVVFYNRNLGSGPTTVVIYNDHYDSTWKYYLPFTKFNQPVGDELLVSPGSPGVIIQFCDPTGWTNHTIADSVPYQNSGANDIETYLKMLTP